VLLVGERGARGFPVPEVGVRHVLPRRVERDAAIAIQPLGPGKQRPHLDPGGARRLRVLARGALDRVEGELAARRLLQRELGVVERGDRVALDAGEVALGDPFARR
jgi:hypothetical protein